MARAHWVHSMEEHVNGSSPVLGCQYPDCKQRAAHQWQRTATEEEVAADAAAEGPYGSVVRNMQGPHRVAVFACRDHAPTPDSMAQVHGAACPAPDAGCDCHDGD